MSGRCLTPWPKGLFATSCRSFFSETTRIFYLFVCLFSIYTKIAVNVQCSLKQLRTLVSAMLKNKYESNLLICEFPSIFVDLYQVIFEGRKIVGRGHAKIFFAPQILLGINRQKLLSGESGAKKLSYKIM